MSNATNTTDRIGTRVKNLNRDRPKIEDHDSVRKNITLKTEYWIPYQPSHESRLKNVTVWSHSFPPAPGRIWFFA